VQYQIGDRFSYNGEIFETDALDSANSTIPNPTCSLPDKAIYSASQGVIIIMKMCNE
jgi:hypothetical protein